MDITISFKQIKDLTEFLRDLFAIVGVFVSVRSYLSQQGQRKIDNSKKLLEQFQNSINENDLNQWKQILLNSYESTGAEPGHFIVFDQDNNPEQIPHAHLFISEGQGFCFPGGKMNLGENVSDINFGSIRRITEQLNIISYEILYGHTELMILYYELGQIMDSIYNWIKSIEDKDSRNNNNFLYPYFLRMYQKNQRKLEKLNYKIYQGLC